MRNLLFIIFLFTGLYLFGPQNSYGQCNPTKHKESTKSKLASGFSYQHSFEITPNKVNAKGELEFTYIFNKGTLYMMNMNNAAGEQKDVIIELYNQKKELVSTNYDSRTGKFWPIGYACNQSGVHYIKIRFKDTKDYCGLVVLAVRK